MKSASENIRTTSATELASIMTACGFTVRLWRDQRVYLADYGRDITAYLEPQPILPMCPADGARLDVRSSWRSERYNGLRCKGVKHAILKDLWAAQLISTKPPADWKDVPLTDKSEPRPPLRPYEASCPSDA